MEEESKEKTLRVIRWIIIIAVIAVGIALLSSLATDVETVLLTINVNGETSPEQMNKILDILDEQEATATFFIPAAWAENNPELAETIAALHEVACFTYSEARLAPLSNESLEKEIVACKEKLESLTNKSVIGFRSPTRDLGGDALLLVAKHYTYDSSTFRKYEWFWEPYPPILLSMPTSSVLLLPADDRWGTTKLHLGDTYYWFLRRAKQKELTLTFSTDILNNYLLDFEYVLAYYKNEGAEITSIETHLEKNLE
ncbi:polysaccharide deacetylase family protein [Candidatus Woesearchaeota archaeon]|nr:polysaccharide deacetylase family protein [Candidatus Woesearchaeota archaeon]